jgi:hypothetical protein
MGCYSGRDFSGGIALEENKNHNENHTKNKRKKKNAR